MKLTLLTIGKTKFPFLQGGIDLYEKRIHQYISFSIQYIGTVREKRHPDLMMLQESEAFRRRLRSDDYIILLDEMGVQYTSVGMATWLQQKLMTSSRRIVFVIGGAYGFSNDMRSISHESVSLSKMTFPHDLVRLIFLEQLYRACTIMKGEQYHH